MIIKRNVPPFLLVILMFVSVIIIGGCKRASTPAPTQTTPHLTPFFGTPERTLTATSQPSPTMEVPYPIQTETPGIHNTLIPYPQPSNQGGLPSASQTPYPAPFETNPPPATQRPEATQIQTATTTASPAPPAADSPTPGSSPAYPAPPASPTNPSYPEPPKSPTNPSYPGPSTPTPRPTRTPTGTVIPGETSVFTPELSATVTPVGGTPGATPIEIPPQPQISPPPAGSSITIWHSWGKNEIEVLQSIINSFKRLYPDVTVSLLYIPKDELFMRYHDASYLRGGPSLLLGPSEWGYKFDQDNLVMDLLPYASSGTLDTINPAALATGFYQGKLLSLPLSQNGLVIFRNTSLITSTPNSFDELITASHQATRAGDVGSYLERGSYFSASSLIGLGGSLMGEDEMPTFDNSYGLAWIDLLAAYDEAGAVTFNTNRDLNMFKNGRVGMIIDGSWSISALAQSIGVENLAIDPWPSFGSGHLSGWVFTDSMYVNSNVTGDDLFATLSFIGYLLDPNAQVRLAEIGRIPSVNTTLPRDPLVQQAMVAFSDGVPYPNSINDSILNTYWKELDNVVVNVFNNGMEPEIALKEASDNIAQIIQELKIVP